MISEDDRTSRPLRVFVSYGHDEHENLADRLRSDLQARGHEVWFDRAELRPGTDWESHIDAGLEWLASDRDRARMILLLTPHAVRRPDGYCLNEVARAVSRRIGIIPVMVALCEPPLSICRIQYLDMQDCMPLNDNEGVYRQSLDVLLATLEGDGPDIEGFASHKLRQLEPIDFAAELAAHPADFVGRAWLFSELQAWIAEPSAPRVFVLVGAPGVGKTALAIELIHRSQHICAFHICAHSSQQKSDARRLVTSLAYQLSTQVPQYEEALKALDLEYVTNTYDASTLFDVLLTQPLARLTPPGSPLVVIIDGLDEATHEGRNGIATFLSERAGQLPRWVRILATTRPEPEVLAPLEALGLHRIEPLASENMADIRSYITARLREVDATSAALEHALEAVAERCEGVMLYARAACDLLSREGVTRESLRTLPEGLSALYARQFAMRCPDSSQFAASTRPLLSLMLAALEPLRFDLICSALKRTQNEVWDIVLALGSLVVDNGDTLTLQHKTLRDWLSDRKASRVYYVTPDEGHAMLSATAANWRSVPRSAREYLFLHGPEHLLHERQWDVLLRVLGDPAFEKGRRMLLDNVLRDVARLDLLLDLVDEMVSARSTDLLNALLDRLQVAIETGHWEVVEAIAEVADAGLEPAQRERMIFLRAWALQQCGRLAESLDVYEQLSLVSPADTEGLVAFRRADALRESGAFDDAFATYADLVRRQGLPQRLEILYGQQYADLLFVRGQFVDALAVLDPLVAQGQGDAQDVFAEALRIRGHVHRVLLEHERALDDYATARAIFTGMGHRLGLARIETNLAETYATTDPERALWHAHQAFSLNEEINMPLEAGKAVRAQGLALVLMGRHAEAGPALDQAAAILTKVGYVQGVCETSANRVILHALREEYAEGRLLTLELAASLRHLNAYPLLVVRSCVVLATRHELDAELTTLSLNSSRSIQWAVEQAIYEERLACMLELTG